MPLQPRFRRSAGSQRRYIRHERVKSALVDTVRYAKLIAAAVDPGTEGRLVASLTTKLNRARAVWGLDGRLAGEETRRIVGAHAPAVVE